MASLGKVMITPKGPYDITGATQYTKLDNVYYGGSSWLAIAPSKGIVPAEGASWTKLANGYDEGLADEMQTEITRINNDLEGKVKKVSFYISDYGAVGDGVTDDTNAFKTCFADMRLVIGHKVLVLDVNKKYLLSDTIELINALTIKSDSKNNVSTVILSNSIYMFSFPDATADGKLWNCAFSNISFVGNNENTFIKSSTLQCWNWNFDNVSIKDFLLAFESIRLYMSTLRGGIWSNFCHGTIRGSDNYFDYIVMNTKDSDQNRPSYALTISSLYVSRLNHIYMTGSMINGYGAYGLIFGDFSNGIILSECWFDGCDKQAIRLENSEGVLISKCQFTGYSRDSVTSNDAIIAIGCQSGQIAQNRFAKTPYTIENDNARPYTVYGSSTAAVTSFIIKDNIYLRNIMGRILENGYTSGVYIIEPYFNLGVENTIGGTLGAISTLIDFTYPSGLTKDNCIVTSVMAYNDTLGCYELVGASEVIVRMYTSTFKCAAITENRANKSIKITLKRYKI